MEYIRITPQLDIARDNSINKWSKGGLTGLVGWTGVT